MPLGSEKLSQFFAGVFRTPETFTHQKGMYVRITHAFDVIGAKNPGLSNHHFVGRDFRQKIDGGIERRFEGAQVRGIVVVQPAGAAAVHRIQRRRKQQQRFAQRTVGIGIGIGVGIGIDIGFRDRLLRFRFR